MSLFARAVFVLLVAATFLAFFAAQRLKSAPQVAIVKRITLQFSPNGDGTKDVAALTLSLRNPDTVTVDVLDADGAAIRRLVTSRALGSAHKLRMRWNGRTDDGGVAPDGPCRRCRVRAFTHAPSGALVLVLSGASAWTRHPRRFSVQSR